VTVSFSPVDDPALISCCSRERRISLLGGIPGTHRSSTLFGIGEELGASTALVPLARCRPGGVRHLAAAGVARAD